MRMTTPCYDSSRAVSSVWRDLPWARDYNAMLSFGDGCGGDGCCSSAAAAAAAAGSETTSTRP